MHTFDVIAGEALARRQEVFVDLEHRLAWGVESVEDSDHLRMALGQTLHAANAGGTVRVSVHDTFDEDAEAMDKAEESEG